MMHLCIEQCKTAFSQLLIFLKLGAQFCVDPPMVRDKLLQLQSAVIHGEEDVQCIFC